MCHDMPVLPPLTLWRGRTMRGGMNVEIVESKEAKRKTYWDFFPEMITNNELKYCGYPMMRHAGKWKRETKEQWKHRNELPFPD